MSPRPPAVEASAACKGLLPVRLAEPPLPAPPGSACPVSGDARRTRTCELCTLLPLSLPQKPRERLHAVLPLHSRSAS